MEKNITRTQRKMTKSFPQQERELMKEPVFQNIKKIDARCPKCKSRMSSDSLRKYGKCYTCSMNEKIART